MRLPRPRRNSIRTKLFAAFAVVLALPAALALVMVPGQLARAKVTAESEKAGALAAMLSYSVTPALVFADSDAVAEIVTSAKHIDEVAYVIILDGNGRVAGAHAEELARPLRFDHFGLSDDGLFLEATSFVVHQGRPIGSVRVGMSLANARASARQSQFQVLVVGGVSLLGVFVVAYILSGLLTRSFTQMVGAAKMIAAGDLTQRVQVLSTDEAGDLANAFNVMIAQLDDTQQALKESNRTLEERVEQRTATLNSEIEERLRTEQALQLSERRFRTMVEAAPIGIALFKADGGLLAANARLESLLGATRAELELIDPASVVVPDDRLELRERLDDLRTGQRLGFQIELQIRSFTGATRWTHCSFSGIRDEAGKLQFIIAMIDDQTEQRELEGKYRQSQKLEAVGHLAGGIAHDFNNLLTTINGLGDLVLEELPDSPARRDVEQMCAAGERAALLTRQLLAFSSRQVLQPVVLEAEQIVSALSKLLHRVIGEHVDLVALHDGSAPRIYADRGQIEQVLMNLVVNARDAMPGGGRLVISTSVQALNAAAAASYGLDSPGRYVLFSVSDTGSGIDPAIRDRIFEPFFTTKEVGRGTGLGLATVYGIVKQSAGGILVESELGSGTTFRVALPEFLGQVAEPALPSPSPRQGSETILLVEDEEALRKMLVRVLRKAGYEVFEATDGQDALRVAERIASPIDLLMTDVVMPRMNGRQLAEWVDARYPGIKTIFMSGYPKDAALHEVLDKNHIFVQKPVTLAALTRTVRLLLDGSVVDTPV